MLPLALALAGALVAPPPLAPHALDGVYRLDAGLVLPYPLDDLFRGWVECTPRGHHRALDIGGVGPDDGLGTRVRSMAKARVVEIGEPDQDPKRFGAPIKDRPVVKRGGRELPAAKDVPGYGKVFFFTRTYGSYRTGRFVATKILDGPLTGMTARYLHLGAIHPGLAVGSVVEAGDELGLLGGTAVLDAPPHVHVDVETPEGDHVDLGRVLGIGPTRVPCGSGIAVLQGIRARYSRAARVLMAVLRASANREGRAAAATREGRAAAAQAATADTRATGCGTTTLAGDFLGGDVSARRIMLPAESAPAEATPWTIRAVATQGKWRPRLDLEDALGHRLAAKATALANGGAELVTPPTPEPLAVRLSAWTTPKAALKAASWRLELTRPCAVP